MRCNPPGGLESSASLLPPITPTRSKKNVTSQQHPRSKAYSPPFIDSLCACREGCKNGMSTSACAEDEEQRIVKGGASQE
eukprot:15365543-Ditylum_brightwellii.AAC.3